MPPSKQLSFSVNPLWTHYLACAVVGLSVLIGFVRYVFLDHFDPLHCGALLSDGQWLDDGHTNWQPEGCMMHSYQPKDVATCMPSQRVVFIGDSVTRKLFFQFAHIVDPMLPLNPPDDDRKHADHIFRSSDDLELAFYWDPFLNTTQTQNILNPSPSDEMTVSSRPALLVLGSGLWYLRYADTSGGLPAWESTIENVLDRIAFGVRKPADEVVVLPVEELAPSKLSRERATTMHPSDIDAMNSDLFHRINPPSSDFLRLFYSVDPPLPVSFPLVFNQMLDPSQTEDGLHFSDSVVKAQANILLNMRCNDVLPKKFPMDKTCCRSYPRPSPLHLVILALGILWGPYIWALTRHRNSRPSGYLGFFTEDQLPPIIFSVAIALIYLGDRTSFWLKEQKHFDPWTFAFLSLLSLAIGLCTVKRADNDLGFLNREQTDEWKGWMQIAILIYHYLGASKVSGIYNPIRVLVAAYLFMTGYGHTTFYLKKADFGFLRVAQIMIRLNLLPIILAYTMNTNYLSYYFSPLVSMWYLIIYATLFVAAKYNDRTIFLTSKIVVSMGVVAWFMSEQWLLEIIFEFLARICGIHWSAKEWSFRVNLDLWIVYFGMLASIAVIKVREHRVMDHPYWPLAVKVSIALSGIVMLWYFAFELMQPSKFSYNYWHPYVSFLPIGAFVVLRNANAILRSASSKAFAFIGRCSLETFIIQFHLWLAADTKGILMVIPATRWRPLNMVITTVMFVYISHQVAQATGEVTNWICGTSKKTLPTTMAEANTSSSSNRHAGTQMQEAIPLVPQGEHQQEEDKDEDTRDDIPREPDTPARPRWADRLAEGTSHERPNPGFRLWYGETEWKPGVKAKVAIGLAVMWLVNVIWPNS